MNIIAYQGSKRKELKIIKQYQPKQFDQIIDVFGGGANVSLGYLKDGYVVQYNDILSSMCGLLTILKDNDKTDSLIKEYNEVVKNNTIEKFYKIFDKEIIISDEARLIYLSCLCFKSMITTRTPKLTKEGIIYKCKKIEYYKKFSELFKKLTITNKDYKDILEQYKNDSNMFLYLDPPYVSKKTNDYGVDFTTKDLKYIKKFMDECKCKVMLHIDFTGYTYDLFKQYIKHYYSIRYDMSGKNKDINDIYCKYHVLLCNY